MRKNGLQHNIQLVEKKKKTYIGLAKKHDKSYMFKQSNFPDAILDI
jgi:hypothetical protein